MRDDTYGWSLGERQETSVGEVAYGVFGEGRPVVLVHGTPMRSYLWRSIVPALAEYRRVYAYDLLGYGEPAIAGHDIGAGIVLRAQLLEGVRFSRVAVLDAVVSVPWLSEPRSSTWHVCEHAGSYEAMPEHLFGAFFSAYLGEANSDLGEEAIEAYLVPWQGEEGRKAFVRQALQFKERHTGEIEHLLGSVEIPVLVVWGEKDGWLDPSQAPRLQEQIPGSELELIVGAGHFVMEDAPVEVSRILCVFFAEDAE